jgi:hypothetical protein
MHCCAMNDQTIFNDRTSSVAHNIAWVCYSCALTENHVHDGRVIATRRDTVHKVMHLGLRKVSVPRVLCSELRRTQQGAACWSNGSCTSKRHCPGGATVGVPGKLTQVSRHKQCRCSGWCHLFVCVSYCQYVGCSCTQHTGLQGWLASDTAMQLQKSTQNHLGWDMHRAHQAARLRG